MKGDGCMDYYKMLFKRKSFHLFRGADEISTEEFCQLEGFLKTVKPLDKNIHTDIRIVPESETTCSRGAQYCILFYSEPDGNYLRNIGYIGELIDLYLASQDIGALWFGIGRPEQAAPDGISQNAGLLFAFHKKIGTGDLFRTAFVAKNNGMTRRPGGRMKGFR